MVGLCQLVATPITAAEPIDLKEKKLDLDSELVDQSLEAVLKSYNSNIN
jgi:hypothetical protein